MTSKVSLRHFGTLFSTTSASTISSTAALIVSASPSTTSRTWFGSTANTESKRASAAALSCRSQPIRRPAASSGTTRPRSKLLQARIWSAKDIGGGSARYAALAGQHGIDPDDLTHAAGEVIDRLAAEPADLHIDRQHRSRYGTLPFLRHEAALGKQFQNTRHNPRFRGGLDGKTDRDKRRVASSDGCGTQRYGRHQTNPRQNDGESARPEPFPGSGG